MGESLRFHPLVADDLKAGTDWYDDISVELGNRFRLAVNAKLDAVESRPESFGLVYESIRAARVAKFPYLIIFEHSPIATEILGIFHSAADPTKWHQRMK